MVVHDKAWAEDLMQESRVAVLEKPDAHHGEASQVTWAIAILKNKVADWYRSPQQKRRVHVKDGATDLGDDPADARFNADGGHRQAVPTWDQPDGLQARQETLQTMASCMRRLPSQTSRMFMMREWLGFETAEICERLDLSPENTRSILHRVRTSLHQGMSAQGISESSIT
jgi:RNA polymerase sigma-70 factor (ECF subfamily)